jgi:hypothetical protein
MNETQAAELISVLHSIATVLAVASGAIVAFIAIVLFDKVTKR